jgi:predicted nucleic acid-binding protein
MAYVVVYDACVLYPAPLRDFLLRLAVSGLFAARWTERIHREWMDALLRERPELGDRLDRTRQLMDEAVPDSLVTGYEPLEAGLSLPDPDDAHVLAAAIRAGAQGVITFNLKDFPEQALAPFEVEAIHPDRFVESQLDLHTGTVIDTARQHRLALKKPGKTPDAYLETLAAQGLVVTADRLAEFSGSL